MREKMTLVDNVIADLQRGNLKARFPIARMDEFGLAMSRFNQMADEIERLVERLRSVEKSRMSLLQDLAHDLRTPVASLKNLLVIIEKKNALSDQEIRSELLSLSRREVDYFERLVEDLLVLAQVSEPSYQTDQEPVSLIDLIEEESESIFARSEPDQKKVEIKNDMDPEQAKVMGDFHLLRRLFRNAMENAHSFAASTVNIRVSETSSHEIKVMIRDDGPGLSDAALKGFGERRVSRAIEKSKGNRLSVGLGSVIMKTVAELHRGKVSAQNQFDNSGKSVGAEILIVLPQMKK
jgi:K+-sensing histidine kinase KdpD